MSINRNYGEYGYIDFSKLWKYMEKKKVNKQYLLNNGLNKGSLYKLVNNENVTCEVIAKLCYILDTQPKNILEYKRAEPRAEDPDALPFS